MGTVAADSMVGALSGVINENDIHNCIQCSKVIASFKIYNLYQIDQGAYFHSLQMQSNLTYDYVERI